MASSANPLCISIALLLCLGLKASARGTVPHKRLLHRVRSISFSSPTYLLYHSGFYVKDIGIGDQRHLPLRCSLPKVHTEFRLRFWLTLSSDPSLAHTRTFFPPRVSSYEFLQAPLLYCLLIPSFQGFGRTFTNSILTIPVARSQHLRAADLRPRHVGVGNQSSTHPKAFHCCCGFNAIWFICFLLSIKERGTR